VFNANAKITLTQFDERHACFVIDDALTDPEGLVEYAALNSGAFRAIDFNAYPGIALAPPPAITEGLATLFNLQMRRHFDVRRVLKMHCRLSMVTLAPSALKPYQWFCHSDGVFTDRAQSLQASMLYLFKDEGLGGTSFYEPARPAHEVAGLFDDSMRMDAEAFGRKHSITPGYMAGSNSYFRCVGSVPARWNRLIFYDGSVLHSGDIAAPDRLSSDPRVGRLTLNGFFTSRRNAS
jgi:hypothetical protein